MALRFPARFVRLDKSRKVRALESSSPLIWEDPSDHLNYDQKVSNVLNDISRSHQRCVLFKVTHWSRGAMRHLATKGIRLSNTAPTKPQKHIMLVSGLPLQDPSAIAVNLHVAGLLSRRKDLLPCPVSFIPLVHPSSLESHELAGLVQKQLLEQAPIENWGLPTNVPLDLADPCRPIKKYITRHNKYMKNIEVDLTEGVVTPTLKRESFAVATPMPILSPEAMHILRSNPLLAQFVREPSLVLELRCAKTLDETAVAARGEEVLKIIEKMAHEVEGEEEIKIV